jgi:predicted RNase H-like nuclease (RuvC/YqgF family)
MFKNENVTIDFLNSQLSLEKEKLSQWQDNLKVHKEILQSVITGSSAASKPSQAIGDSNVCFEWFYTKNHYSMSNCVAQLRNTITDKDTLIDTYLAEVLVLKKVITQMEDSNDEKEIELKERNEEIKVKLERTENMFQSTSYLLNLFFIDKEKKWAELERIVVNYARKDLALRNKLTEIKYIWDDPSSKRRITTVVEENEVLRSQIDELKSDMGELRSQMDNAKSNPTMMYEEEDYFKLGDQFEEDEVPMEKMHLNRRGSNMNNRLHTSPNNVSGLSDNTGVLDQAFIDKSRIDTSNINDTSILGQLKNEPVDILVSMCYFILQNFRSAK